MTDAAPTDSSSSSKPTPQHPRDPLHGVTLEMVLNHLVENYGWERMGMHIKIRCFTHDPTINSSLKFLRRNPWARQKVERMYVRLKRKQEREANEQ